MGQGGARMGEVGVACSSQRLDFKNVAVFQQHIKAKIEKSGAESTGQSKVCAARLRERKRSAQGGGQRGTEPRALQDAGGAPGGWAGQAWAGRGLARWSLARSPSALPPSLPRIPGPSRPRAVGVEGEPGAGRSPGAAGSACRGPGRVPGPRGVRRESQLLKGTLERVGPRGHLHAPVGETGVTLPW